MEGKKEEIIKTTNRNQHRAFPTGSKSWCEDLEQSEIRTISTTPRFIVVKMDEEGKTFNNISPFVIHKWISSFSKHINVKKMKKIGNLLLDVQDTKAAIKIMAETHFYNFKISVAPHNNLNKSQGVFYCKDLRDIPDSEILAELESQFVSSVRRLGSGDSNNPRSLFVATFDRPQLPDRIVIGYLSIPLRPYIPQPMICTNCYQMGHRRSKCNNHKICKTCSEESHEGLCSAIKCMLCKGNHANLDKSCPKLIEETQIKKIMVINKVSYYEARKLVISKKTYADIAKQNNNDSTLTMNLKATLSKLEERIEVLEKSIIEKLEKFSNSKECPSRQETSDDNYIASTEILQKHFEKIEDVIVNFEKKLSRIDEAQKGMMTQKEEEEKQKKTSGGHQTGVEERSTSSRSERKRNLKSKCKMP